MRMTFDAQESRRLHWAPEAVQNWEHGASVATEPSGATSVSSVINMYPSGSREIFYSINDLLYCQIEVIEVDQLYL